MTPDTNKERAEFEAWYASTDDAPAEPDHIYEFDEDGMNELAKGCIWLGWQARAAKAPAAPTGWYALAADGMATLCVDRDDAEKTAAESEKEWPNCGPFRAVQLYTAPPAPTEQWMPKDFPMTTSLTSISLTALPALRAPFAGGIFAGITTKDGAHCAVALLPDQGSNLDWPAATKWAEALGATLPTRPVAAMLFANVKDQLRTGWHWTCEQDEDDASCAWYCYFDGGNQNDFRKSYEGSAVAVRLIPLNS